MSVRVCVCVLRQGLRQPRLRTENKSLARETKVDAELRRRFPERLLNDKVRVCEHYTVTSYCSLNVTACELFFLFLSLPFALERPTGSWARRHAADGVTVMRLPTMICLDAVHKIVRDCVRFNYS